MKRNSVGKASFMAQRHNKMTNKIIPLCQNIISLINDFVKLTIGYIIVYNPCLLISVMF